MKAAGKSVQLLVGEGYNHFEVIETLSNPYGLLGRAALEQMQIANMRRALAWVNPGSVLEVTPNQFQRSVNTRLRRLLPPAELGRSASRG